MHDAPVDAYLARFRRVLAYIDAHLEGDLSVERLSAVAAYSRCHFQRQFAELFGLGVYRYVQLTRLKRASYRLAFRGASAVTDIALDSGYESPEAFARAFKRSLGQTPSEFRRAPRWEAWQAAYRHLHDLRNQHMTQPLSNSQVRVITVDEVRVATLEHRGDPRRLGDTIRRFIAWRKQVRLPPAISATYNILYDDPDDTPPDEFRLDVCAATDREIAENPQGVVARTIPGGRCAVLRHVGSDDTLGAALRHLYAEWLPQSGEEPRDFPPYVQRVRFFPDVPEHEAVTDVFLPLRDRPAP